MFFDFDANAFPQGAQFFYNIVIAIIVIPYDSNILPLNILDYWYLDALCASRPFAIHIYRDATARSDGGFDVETYPHCTLELDPNYEVCWYNLIDYDTEDPWDLTPILEDFDYNEEDD